jgi:hypothetical protein
MYFSSLSKFTADLFIDLNEPGWASQAGTAASKACEYKVNVEDFTTDSTRVRLCECPTDGCQHCCEIPEFILKRTNLTNKPDTDAWQFEEPS